MLEGSAIGIVIGRVAIDEAIQEQGIEGEAPVVRRRIVCVVLPFTYTVSVSGLSHDEGAGDGRDLPQYWAGSVADLFSFRLNATCAASYRRARHEVSRARRTTRSVDPHMTELGEKVLICQIEVQARSKRRVG